MSNRILKGLLGIAAVLALLSSANAENVNEPAKSVLSHRQQQVIRTEFSKIESPAERKMAMEWSDAKKVAETMCRPIALKYFQKEYKDADRVFLGNDKSDSLRLMGNEVLTGVGQVRAGGTWYYFNFACPLNPRNGRAKSFGADITSSQTYSRQSI